VLLALALAASLGASVFADVKTEEKTLIRFEGMLGRMSRMFAGKAAKEGLIATVAVKGNRMARIDDETGEIIDLAEEKVYQLDLKKKTYRPLTFEQMRQQYEAAMKKADEQMKELREAQEPPAKDQKDQKAAEVEMDVTVNETGQRKTVAGYDCRELVSTVTVRQKGKTIDQGGGLVITTSAWLAPKIPAMREIMEFERRYAEKLLGPAMIAKAQEMATVFAMYPGMGEAMRRAQEEAAKMDGTPLLTVTRMETVAGTEQAAQRDQAEQQKQEEEAAPTGLGGLGGLMGKKFMKKKAEEPKPPQGAGNRTTMATTTTEYLKISGAATDADVAIPAGFRERGQPQ
jgi:hypothetical protein